MTFESAYEEKPARRVSERIRILQRSLAKTHDHGETGSAMQDRQMQKNAPMRSCDFFDRRTNPRLTCYQGAATSAMVDGGRNRRSGSGGRKARMKSDVRRAAIPTACVSSFNLCGNLGPIPDPCQGGSMKVGRRMRAELWKSFRGSQRLRRQQPAPFLRDSRSLIVLRSPR
jgi:hypothetical protein